MRQGGEKTLDLGGERRGDFLGGLLQSLRKEASGTQTSVFTLQNIQFYKFFIKSGEEYFLNRNLTTWKHAQAHKDKDCCLRAAGGHGLHVHCGGNGPLGSAQPQSGETQ